ncbi:MAG: FliG C-terminal domain-containing protein [Buchnera aphidicola (Nurudea yanoniella)]
MIILNGIEKSAILLITLGINEATKILNELSISEVQSLIKCMFNLGKIPRVIVDQVLLEFKKNFSLENSTTIVNKNYVISLSKKVLGEKNSINLFNEIENKENISRGIQKLNMIDPKNIATLLKHEHPQIISAILIYLNKNQSAAILSYLEELLSLDIIFRISQFSGLTKSGEQELIEVINYILKNYQKSTYHHDGVSVVINLLKLMTYDKEQHIINGIEKSNKKLADIIKSKLYLFENISNFDDDCIKYLIKKTTLHELSIAMHSSSELLRKKFFKNMSQTDSECLKNFFTKENSISIDDIKKAQNNLLNIIKDFLK